MRGKLFAGVVALLYLFLLAPVILVVPLSFSNDSYLVFPPETWGIRWYASLLTHPLLMRAFRTSVLLASLVTMLSLAIGVPAAHAIARHRFVGRDWLFSLFTAPILLPSIVLGLAILLVFVRFNLLATYPGLLIAHLVVTLPYVLRIVTTALGTLTPSIEEAALSLGAHPLTVFRRVTVPMMMPGVVASAALSFLISFDEVVISLFIVGPSLTTLPVEMYRYVEGRMDPLIAAASVVLITGTIVIVTLLERTIGFSRAIGK
jgi:putative spermidine/putrescine transport system permease protein